MAKSLYRVLKDVWQLLPGAWNDKLRSAPLIGRLVRVIANATVRTAQHQEIYDSRYYDFVDATAAASANVMGISIIEEFSPAVVIDVGCGTGALLAEIKKHSIQVYGLEHSEEGVMRCLAKNIQVGKFDLESKQLPSIPAQVVDLTLSFEVAEHLPPSLADHYISVICSFSPIVVMTAAIPGQGGLDHVNEQPHAYWIEKMSIQGFIHDAETSIRLRERWTREGVAFWYANNVMVFRKAPQ